MTAPIFPNEPIREPGDRVPFSGEAWDHPDSDEQFDPDARACWTCTGEGWIECDEDDCFHAKAHIVVCRNCHGSGDAKDVWYW